MRITFIIAALFITGLAIAQQKNSSNTTGINFEKISLEKAMAKAKASKKNIYIYFTDSLCSACKKMEKNVFTKNEVFDTYNSLFINLKMNDIAANAGFKKKYHIISTPTHLFLNSKGEMIHKATGPMESQPFVELGNIAINSNENLAALRKEYTTNAARMSNERLYNYVMTLYNASESYSAVAEDYFSKLDERQFSNPEILKSVFLLCNKVKTREFRMLASKYQEVYFGYEFQEVRFHIMDMLVRTAINVEKQNPAYHYRDTLTQLCEFVRFPYDEVISEWANIVYSREISHESKSYYQEIVGFINHNFDMFPVSKKIDFANDIAENCKDSHLKEEALRWMQISFEKKQDPNILVAMAVSLFYDNRQEEAMGLLNSALQFGSDQGEDMSDLVNFYKKKFGVENK